MNYFYGFFISIFLIFIFSVSFKKYRDLFSPLCIFSFFQFLRYVPGFFINDQNPLYNITSETIFFTFIYETIFITTVFLGYEFVSISGKTRKNIFLKSSMIDFPLYLILLLYLVGFASRLYLIKSIGSISYVIKNMGSSYVQYTTKSNGYILALGNLMTLAILMLIYKISFLTKKRLLILLLFSMILFSMLSYLVVSSRSPALEILMISIFGYNYLIKKIKFKNIFRPSFLIILFIVFFIIVIFPYLRLNSYDKNIGINLSDVSSNTLSSFFSAFSSFGVDTFVYNYFNFSNFWFGANFANLFTAFIPSSIFTNKPCIDDGVYVCNLMYGYNVSPNTSRNLLIMKYSMPFSTPSCMYANFGVIGIIFVGFALGIIYKKTYFLLKRNVCPFMVFFYQLITYQLEFSTLSISQTIVPLAVSFLAYFICIKLLKNKNKNKNSNSIKNKKV